MNKRTKKEDRAWLSKSEKLRILSKSDGKCCHCGMSIEVGGNFTVEHAIPIAKGGENCDANLVALCRKCNEQKRDFVVRPDSSYFKFLNEEHRIKMKDMYTKYLSNTSWFTQRNFMREDKLEIEYELRSGWYGRSMCNRRNSGVIVRAILTLSKAAYSDLDEILNCMIKYNKKYGLETWYLKANLDYYFTKGAIYILRNGAKEIVSIIPISLSKMFLREEGIYTILPEISSVYMMSKKEEYIKPVQKALCEILGCISMLFPEGYVLPYTIWYLKADTFSRDVACNHFSSWVMDLEETKDHKKAVYAVFVDWFKGNVEVGSSVTVDTSEMFIDTSIVLQRSIGMNYNEISEFIDVQAFNKLRGYKILDEGEKNYEKG